MNRHLLLALVIVLSLTGTTAWAIRDLKSRQRLGRPGLKVVAEPQRVLETARLGETNMFVASTNSVYLPPVVLNYRSMAAPLARVVWDALPKDTVFGQRLYVAPDGFQVQNTVVMMGADRTSIHQPQICLVASGWKIDRQEETTIPIALPHAYNLPVMRLKASIVQKMGDTTQSVSGVYVYWFVADGEVTAGHKSRMWSMARALVKTGVLQRWAYVIYFATCPPGAEDATYRRMTELITQAVPEYQLATPTVAK